MATGTIILRPSRDISLNHTTSVTGSTGFSMLSETKADGNSTCIQQHVTYFNGGGGGSKVECLSSFNVSGQLPKEKINITNIKFNINASVSEPKTVVNCSLQGKLKYNNQLCTTPISATKPDFPSKKYKDISNGNASNLISLINQDLNNGVDILPNFVLEIYSTGECDYSGTVNKSAKPFDIRITQAYVELAYETITEPSSHFFIKENNVFVEYSAVYKKENGKWTKQDFETALSGLTNGSKTNFVKNKK